MNPREEGVNANETKSSPREVRQDTKETGITEQMYQRYEYGYSTPNVRTAIRIANAFGVIDLRELFAEATEEDTQLYDITRKRSKQEVGG